MELAREQGMYQEDQAQERLETVSAK
jgi:hypothetical protein